MEPCQTSNMELFMKVATFLTKPLHIGQIYVRGIFEEHSLEIFPVYSEKILDEIPGNIPKLCFGNFESRNILWLFHEYPTNVTRFF